jgi:hypothetical protein
MHAARGDERELSDQRYGERKLMFRPSQISARHNVFFLSSALP